MRVASGLPIFAIAPLADGLLGVVLPGDVKHVAQRESTIETMN
jgi:hypothetical protein